MRVGEEAGFEESVALEKRVVEDGLGDAQGAGDDEAAVWMDLIQVRFDPIMEQDNSGGTYQ